MNRKSLQRDAILTVLKNTSSHPGADWIYERVRKKIPNISLGTVYRNLRLLESAGEILKLDFASNLSHFDGNTSEHSHFKCEKCERIFDIEEPLTKAIEFKIAQDTGFLVTRHRLEFYGLCHECHT